MIGIVVIVGAASGVIVFNFILVTWCLFYQRKQRLTKVELQTIPLQKRSSLPKGKKRTVRFAASAIDPLNKPSYPTSRPPHYLPSPLASVKVRTRRSDRPRAENLFAQTLSTTVPTTTNRAPSVRSDDTASVYSTASAPLEIHDYWSRSHNPSNAIPVTPTSSASEMLSTAVTSSRNPALISPPCTGNRLSVVEEGLNPKTYNQAIQQRPRQASRRWRQQQPVSRDQSACGQTSPGILGSFSSAENIDQALSSAPLPSPYSPPSRW
jgi:hypothetical protein